MFHILPAIDSLDQHLYHLKHHPEAYRPPLCPHCGRGGAVKIIASIEDPTVIRKILAHLDQKVSLQQAGCLPESQAPPPTAVFD